MNTTIAHTHTHQHTALAGSSTLYVRFVPQFLFLAGWRRAYACVADVYIFFYFDFTFLFRTSDLSNLWIEYKISAIRLIAFPSASLRKPCSGIFATAAMISQPQMSIMAQRKNSSVRWWTILVLIHDRILFLYVRYGKRMLLICLHIRNDYMVAWSHGRVRARSYMRNHFALIDPNKGFQQFHSRSVLLGLYCCCCCCCCRIRELPDSISVRLSRALHLRFTHLNGVVHQLY